MKDTGPTNFTELGKRVYYGLQRHGLLYMVCTEEEHKCKGANDVFNTILKSYIERSTRETHSYNDGFKSGKLFMENDLKRREDQLQAERDEFEEKLENLKNMTVLELANWLTNIETERNL